VLVAAGLRLWGLGNRSFWFDEAATILAALHGPLDGLTEPPLYALLLRGWLALVPADSEWLVRLPSAACAVACVPLLALWVRWRLGGRAAWIAAALVAVAPAQLVYAQEARMYAPAVLAGLAAVLLLERALQARPGRDAGRWWAAYGAAVAMSGLLHFGALLLLPGHAALVSAGPPPAGAGRPAPRRRRPVAPWRAFAVSAALGVLPAVWSAAAIRRNLAHARAHPVEVARSAGAYAREAAEFASVGPLAPEPIRWPAIAAFAAAAAAGVAAAPRTARLPAAALGLLPAVALPLLAAAGAVHVAALRYALPAHPFFLALCAAGAAAAPRGGRVAAAGVLLAAQAVSAAPYLAGAKPVRGLMPAKKPLRAVATFVRANWRGGDALINVSASSAVPLRVYLPGRPLAYVLRDPTIPPRMERIVGSPVPLRDALRGARRIWLVASPVRFEDPPGVPSELAPVLDRCGADPLRFSFSGVEVYLARVHPGCR
jgi:mannosyltransferase